MVNFDPLAAEIGLPVWGTPANFNGFCVLAALLHGTLVAVVSQTAALNRGRYLYLPGWPSRLALAHILVTDVQQLRLCWCRLQVFNAKKLSCRYVPHPYCIVSLNEVKVCRTQIKEAPDACWDEEFILESVIYELFVKYCHFLTSLVNCNANMFKCNLLMSAFVYRLENFNYINILTNFQVKPVWFFLSSDFKNSSVV